MLSDFHSSLFRVNAKHNLDSALKGNDQILILQRYGAKYLGHDMIGLPSSFFLEHCSFSFDREK